MFSRNNGGIPKKAYPKRQPIAVNRANPMPRKPPVSVVNSKEKKALTGVDASITLRDSGQCFHLDQIPQGVGLMMRLGQKHRVTGVHIRGSWIMQVNTREDMVGYYLVWDRQPNEILANPADILYNTGTQSLLAFPNQDNNERFVFLARKTHKATVATYGATVAETVNNDSTIWMVDDYFDFSDKMLVANQVLAGDGAIGDRTTGALLMVGIGIKLTAYSNTLGFDYRCYFEDV